MSDSDDRPNPWAMGGTFFAAAILLTAGILGIVQGISAIAKDPILIDVEDYVFKLDVTTWGWIHLILGIVLAATGGFLFTGRKWARATAMMLAGLSIIANFIWLPYYALGGIVMIVINILVIWAIGTYDPRGDGGFEPA